jgi:type II secretory pathway component GspD/PulD (secretin)
MTRFAIVAAACAVLAFGQPAILERQVTLVHLKSPDALTQLLRFTAVLTTVTPDKAARTITLQGTAEQIALAEWLIAQLDKATGVIEGNPEYRSSDDDITRVLPVAHATGNRELAELGTVVRSIFEIQKLYTFADTKSMVVRGTAAQIAGAEWLLRKLDRPVSTIGDKRDDRERFRPFGSTDPDPDDSVAVLHLANTSTEQSHSAAATSIRSTTQAHRAFVYMPTRVIVIRGTVEQLATAESIVADIDKPAV